MGGWVETYLHEGVESVEGLGSSHGLWERKVGGWVGGREDSGLNGQGRWNV